jgi:hypothetical protein
MRSLKRIGIKMPTILHGDHVLICHDAKKHKQKLPCAEDAGEFCFSCSDRVKAVYAMPRMRSRFSRPAAPGDSCGRIFSNLP